MHDADWQKWFEGIWADREERLYRQFFGDLGPGIFTLSAESFGNIGCQEFDPRWLHHGVFECPPAESRPHWLYVTSGMSNPWGDDPDTLEPDGYSGLGMEYVVHAPAQAKWPILLLHWFMAVQLLVAAGKLKGGLVEYGDRVSLGQPLAKPESHITHLLITHPEPPCTYPPSFALASGKVDLMLLIGITARERDFAKAQDSPALLQVLQHHHIFPLTDPDRSSVV